MLISEDGDAADVVRRHLTRLVRSGGFRAGDKLPTERALAAELAVPRGAVREALAVLEVEGAVVRRLGSGTFVAAAEPFGSSARTVGHDVSPSEIMATRLMFEPKMAELAVAHATASDFERLEVCNRSAEAAISLEEFEKWDAALHQAIAGATHNRLVIEIFKVITGARERAEWGELKQRSLTEERRAQYHADHRRIVAALRMRDSEKAENEILRHLIRVRQNLFGA